MSEIRIVKESKKGLSLLGKRIIHKKNGEGIVVGFSSKTGSPFAFFYSIQEISDRVMCFSEEDIIDVL